MVEIIDLPDGAPLSDINDAPLSSFGCPSSPLSLFLDRPGYKTHVRVLLVCGYSHCAQSIVMKPTVTKLILVQSISGSNEMMNGAHSLSLSGSNEMMNV